MEATITGPKECPTGTAVTAQEHLWRRLQRFSFDQPGPYPYSKRLAKENEWPYEYAQHVIEEYRKFLLLLATVDTPIVPPPHVELAWRLHLIYTQSYYGALCKDVLGKRINHVCEDGRENWVRVLRRFEKTLNLYRAVFHSEPPAAIWYEPEALGGPLHHRLRQSFTWSLGNRRAAAKNAARIENVPAEHAELWRRIKNFKFDKVGAAYPYSRRLADENGWDQEYTHQVIEEYRRFLYLLRTAGHMVTPSLDVDEAWHLHMENSQSYWDDLCGGVMGNRPIQHHPGNGTAEDERKFQAIYERTLFEYSALFGQPPYQVWGEPNPNIDWREVLRGVNI